MGEKKIFFVTLNFLVKFSHSRENAKNARTNQMALGDVLD